LKTLPSKENRWQFSKAARRVIPPQDEDFQKSAKIMQLDLYTFNESNPLRFVDEDGRQPFDVTQFEAAVTRLQNVLSGQGHGALRGTFEGAIAQAQGGRILSSSGEPSNKIQQLRNLQQSLSNNLSIVRTQIELLKARDVKAAQELSKSFQPLRELASKRLELANRTMDLIRQIKELGAVLRSGVTDRLSNTPIAARSRDVSGLVSEQLRNLRMGLVPHLREQASALLREISRIPATISAARQQVAAASASITSSLAALKASGSSSLLRYLGTSFQTLINLGSRLSNFIIMIVPEDDPGAFFRLPCLNQKDEYVKCPGGA
jgi:hypothetical protein